jgi:transcription elongation factor GreA
MIHLLDITFREIDNKRDVSTNRRLNKQIQAFLFQEGKLEEYLMRTDADSVNRLFTLVNDIDQLDPNIRIELKHKIVERFPDFKFYGVDAMETVSRGLMVTRTMYEKKSEQLQHILDVEIPATSKEIGEARELGDLKENAEYKAGKEKLEMLNLNASKIKEDLERATIFDKKDIDPSKVSFGTVVTLYNNILKKEEIYKFFGPWESNPEKNIISYLSPFGGKLWNHVEGEDVKFEINERSYDYTIKKIEAAEF